MATGYYIRLYDKTSCGGSVLEATSGMGLHGLDQSREGDAVRCGVDGKTYRIRGGISHMTSDGIRLAGTWTVSAVARAKPGWNHRCSVPPTRTRTVRRH
jgi:uncharacterized Zn-binding protein involved in type VI secretion